MVRERERERVIEKQKGRRDRIFRSARRTAGCCRDERLADIALDGMVEYNRILDKSAPRRAPVEQYEWRFKQDYERWLLLRGGGS